MLTRWAVPIAGIDPARVKLDHLHAVASGWIDEGHWESPKPWSISPLRIVDGVAALEVSTLTVTARDRLHAGVVAGQRVRFGAQYGSVLAQPQPVAAVGWEQLAQPSNVTAWCVRFLTPTAFGNGRRFSPWPDPFAVTRSLTQRWNALHPDGVVVELTPQDCGRVWVSDVDGRSETLSLGGLTVSGFLGRIRYVCDEPDVATLFGRLLRLAEFAGLGRYSARGLGTVRLDPTWQTKAATRRTAPC